MTYTAPTNDTAICARDFTYRPSRAERDLFDEELHRFYGHVDVLTRYFHDDDLSHAFDQLVGAGYRWNLVADFIATLALSPTYSALVGLLDDETYPLFGFVAACSDRIDHDTFHLLSTSPFSPTAVAVAANAATPICVLGALAYDAGEQVAAAVADNPVTPLETVASLVHHPSFHVRQRAAESLLVRHRCASSSDPAD